MSRLIDADTLIKEIESLSVHITGVRIGKGVLADSMKEYKKSVLRIIDEQPTASDWIPCSERLPEEYTEVLGCDYEGDIYVVELYKDYVFGKIWKQWNGGDLKLNVIIAWQPLTEPYKQEDKKVNDKSGL